MSKKKKKETIGVIKGTDLLRNSRGVQEITFRTGGYNTKKDRPRDKNWKKWI